MLNYSELFITVINKINNSCKYSETFYKQSGYFVWLFLSKVK